MNEFALSFLAIQSIQKQMKDINGEDKINTDRLAKRKNRNR